MKKKKKKKKKNLGVQSDLRHIERGLEFQIFERIKTDCTWSDNKNADQLHGFPGAAYSRFCCQKITKKKGFLMKWLIM